MSRFRTLRHRHETSQVLRALRKALAETYKDETGESSRITEEMVAERIDELYLQRVFNITRILQGNSSALTV